MHLLAQLAVLLGGLLTLSRADESGKGPDGTYQATEIAWKSPVEIVKLRGFDAEVHYAKTRDGYFINLVNIIHPNRDSLEPKRPVIFNHGIFMSSTAWLLMSRDAKPTTYFGGCQAPANETLREDNFDFINAPLMLANAGFDVWVMSMRGTDYSLHHSHLRPTEPEYWNFSLDEFVKHDVPTAINFVRRRTGAPKVGYVAHSQATFAIFGLLATRPEYAQMVEPIVAVSPIAYLDHSTSIFRLMSVPNLNAVGNNIHGPFPPSAKRWRKLIGNICRLPKNEQKATCQLVADLFEGEGKPNTVGFYSQYPFYSSLKTMNHFAQLMRTKRFATYDHGEKENLRIHGSRKNPDYLIRRIKSKSIIFVTSKTDNLSNPTDVSRFKAQLRVPLFSEIFINRTYNHINLVASEDNKYFYFPELLKWFEHFEAKDGVCAKRRLDQRLGHNEDELLAVALADFPKLLASSSQQALPPIKV